MTFRCCMTQSFTSLLTRSRSYASLSQVVGSVHSSKIVRGQWAAKFPKRFSKHFEIQLQRSFASLHEYASTIYALSTAPGRAAIAIIRISGTACLDVRTQQPNGAFSMLIKSSGGVSSTMPRKTTSGAQECYSSNSVRPTKPTNECSNPRY